MKLDKFVTVVFRVDDWEKFQPQWNAACDSMGDERSVNGAVVTGLSRYDEMSRVEQLEDLLRENDIDVPQPEVAQ